MFYLLIIFLLVINVCVKAYTLIPASQVPEDAIVFLLSGNLRDLKLPTPDCESSQKIRKCKPIYKTKLPTHKHSTYLLRFESLDQRVIVEAIQQYNLQFKLWVHVNSVKPNDIEMKKTINLLGWISQILPTFNFHQEQLVVVEDLRQLSSQIVQGNAPFLDQRQALVTQTFPEWNLFFQRIEPTSKAENLLSLLVPFFEVDVSSFTLFSARSFRPVPLAQVPIQQLPEATLSFTAANLNPIYSTPVKSIPEDSKVVLFLENDQSTSADGASEVINRLTRCNLNREHTKLLACAYRQNKTRSGETLAYLIPVPRVSHRNIYRLAKALLDRKIQVAGLVYIDAQAAKYRLQYSNYFQLLQLFYLMHACFGEEQLASDSGNFVTNLFGMRKQDSLEAARIVYIQLESPRETPQHANLELKYESLQKEFPTWRMQALSVTTSGYSSSRDINALEHVVTTLIQRRSHCLPQAFTLVDVKQSPFNNERVHFPPQFKSNQRLKLTLLLGTDRGQLVQVINHVSECNLRFRDLDPGPERFQLAACGSLSHQHRAFVPLPYSHDLNTTTQEMIHQISKTLHQGHYEIEHVVVLTSHSNTPIEDREFIFQLWKFVNDWMPTCFDPEDAALSYIEIPTSLKRYQQVFDKTLQQLDQMFPQWSIQGEIFQTFKSLGKFLNEQIVLRRQCLTRDLSFNVKWDTAVQLWTNGRQKVAKLNPIAQQSLEDLPNDAKVILFSSLNPEYLVNTINALTKCDLQPISQAPVACEYRGLKKSKVYLVPIDQALKSDQASREFFYRVHKMKWQILAFIYLDAMPDDYYYSPQTFNTLRQLLPECFNTKAPTLLYFHQKSATQDQEKAREQKEQSFRVAYKEWKGVQFRTIKTTESREIEQAISEVSKVKQTCPVATMQAPTTRARAAHRQHFEEEPPTARARAAHGKGQFAQQPPATRARGDYRRQFAEVAPAARAHAAHRYGEAQFPQQAPGAAHRYGKEQFAQQPPATRARGDYRRPFAEVAPATRAHAAHRYGEAQFPQQTPATRARGGYTRQFAKVPAAARAHAAHRYGDALFPEESVYDMGSHFYQYGTGGAGYA